MTSCRLLIVGSSVDYHVGAHFRAAAADLNWSHELVDTRNSWTANRWLNRIFYHGLKKRPVRLGHFGRAVIDRCRSFRPELLLSTGVAPLSEDALREIGNLGIRRVNFLTDDPWNPVNAAGFFWKALRQYDVVFTPRRANISDLRGHGCRRVEYLPFAFNPNYHLPESPAGLAELEKFGCDISIIGGADQDRLPIARALMSSGLKLHLYGGYWDKFNDLKVCDRGLAYGSELRKAVAGAAVNVCMVRRANRDGHAMRSYELPAMAACMIAESTQEHREIFGEEGLAVHYFKNPEEVVRKAQDLIADPEARQRLREAAHRLIVDGRNTYADRLLSMLSTC